MNIIYFLGFLVFAAFLVVADYIEKDKLDLGSNIFQALFVMIFIRVMFWVMDKGEKEINKGKDQH